MEWAFLCADVVFITENTEVGKEGSQTICDTGVEQQRLKLGLFSSNGLNSLHAILGHSTHLAEEITCW